MRASRRSLLKGAGAVALVAGPVRAAALAPALAIYDQRLGESRRFARASRAPGLSLGELEAANWKQLRGALPPGKLVGLTRWSDLVLVRGYAEEQGKRIRYEKRRGLLFEWEMG